MRFLGQFEVPNVPGEGGANGSRQRPDQQFPLRAQPFQPRAWGAEREGEEAAAEAEEEEGPGA
jgi:hypothetical protein